MPTRSITAILAGQITTDADLLTDLLALAPVHQPDFRPPWLPAFSLAELTTHLTESLAGLAACFHRLHPDRLAHFLTAPRDSTTLRHLIAEGFAATTDSDLDRAIPTYFTPTGEPFLSVLLVNQQHLHHHTYQLFVYLKLLGIPVETRHLYRFKTNT